MITDLNKRLKILIYKSLINYESEKGIATILLVTIIAVSVSVSLVAIPFVIKSVGTTFLDKKKDEILTFRVRKDDFEVDFGDVDIMSNLEITGQDKGSAFVSTTADGLVSFFPNTAGQIGCQIVTCKVDLDISVDVEQTVMISEPEKQKGESSFDFKLELDNETIFSTGATITNGSLNTRRIGSHSFIVTPDRINLLEVDYSGNISGKSIKESSNTIAILSLGIGGTALTLKRKLKTSKSTQKELKKLS